MLRGVRRPLGVVGVAPWRTDRVVRDVVCAAYRPGGVQGVAVVADSMRAEQLHVDVALAARVLPLRRRRPSLSGTATCREKERCGEGEGEGKAASGC